MRLEEVMDNVTVYTEIFGLHEGGDAEYGEQTNENGEVERFHCIACGYVIRDDNDNAIHEYTDLFEELSNRGWLV